MKPAYRKMLRGLPEAPGSPPEWSVYIVRCADQSLYTGIAKDVAGRVEAHNAGRGAAYTRSRRPVRLLWSEPGLTRSAALVREAAVKRLPRERKSALAGEAGPAGAPLP